MNRVKHFLILVLALTMSLGAWAQTDPAVQVTKDNNLDWNFTMPDYNVQVNVEYYNGYVLTLASNGNGVVGFSGDTLPQGVTPGTTANTYLVVPGTQVTLNATANQGYHLQGWRYDTDNSCGGCWLSNNQPENPLQLTVTSDTNITAVFAITPAELAWSTDEFTGYRLIDFNNWKPTLNNPHNVDVRYGCVEGNDPDNGGVVVDAQTGVVGSWLNNFGYAQPVAGTFHIYAVHETDQTYYYDSVIYTLHVLPSAMVVTTKIPTFGGTISMPDATSGPSLTHFYYSLGLESSANVAQGDTLNVLAQPAEGYHFRTWSLNLVDLSTEASYTYRVPDILSSSFAVMNLRAVFDTNTYALTVVVANGQSNRGTVAGSNSAAKHFLEYEISATPSTNYHFLEWNDGNTDNPRLVSLVSDSTFTASFAPDTFTVTYMDGTSELKVEKVPYREAIPEYSPSRLGWKFVGWDPALPELMPGENLTTYAQWTCDSVLDVDGNKYPAVQIGSKCWMAENLRTTHYADGRDIANIYDYQTVTSPTVPQHYGFLYDWYDAADVNRPSTRATSPTYTQGVCPTGYHIPTAEEVAVLNAVPATDQRSTTDWIACDNNNSTGFTAYPAGMYNLSLSRYEGIGTETSWWSMMEPNPSTVSTPSGTVTAVSFCTAYYCSTLFIKSYPATYAISVRCVLNE